MIIQTPIIDNHDRYHDAMLILGDYFGGHFLENVNISMGLLELQILSKKEKKR